MLEGVEKETLEKWAKECNEKYHKLFIQTLQKPLLGEIGTNGQMIKELKDLNMSYFEEMSDYTDDFVSDLDGGFIELFEKAEENGINVIQEAKECLFTLKAVDDMLNAKHWVNEDGHICDEEGNRLSEDREHRVFEVIKGGKHDD